MARESRLSALLSYLESAGVRDDDIINLKVDSPASKISFDVTVKEFKDFANKE